MEYTETADGIVKEWKALVQMLPGDIMVCILTICHMCKQIVVFCGCFNLIDKLAILSIKTGMLNTIIRLQYSTSNKLKDRHNTFTFS